MKTTNILALSLSTCLLVACGGSDSPKLHSHHDKVPEKYTVSGSDSLYTNKDVFSGAKPNQATGFAFANAGGDKRMLVHGFSEPNHDTIKIGVHTIKLPDVKEELPGQISVGQYNKDLELYVSTSNYSPYVRIGYYNLKRTNDTGSLGVFANGSLTAIENMPTKGTFRYQGSDMQVGGFYKPRNKPLRKISGALRFDVDFGAKTVKGNIGRFTVGGTLDSSIQAIAVNAKIYGNKFMQDKGAMVNGGFYGPAAEQLAGVATQDNVSVAFGAKKQ